MNKKNNLIIEEYKEKTLDDLEKVEEFNQPIIEDEELNEAEKKSSPKKKNKAKLIINIVFVILIILITIISIDIVCVAKYDKGPFFAIKTAVYKDGGSKVYYGIGYKVIKYNLIRGKKGMEIGTWGLKYNSNPTNLSSLDLAIEFTNNPKKAYFKFYKKFLRVNGTFVNKDETNNKLTLAYIDEDGKYNLDIVCTMGEEINIPEYPEGNNQITVVGTVTDFEPKTDTKNRTLYMSNCFDEQ